MEREAQSHQPLLWAALAFATGIGAGAHCWRPATWWMVAAVVFIAASAFWTARRSLLSTVSVLVAFAVLGAMAVQLSRGPQPGLDLGTLADGRTVVVTSYVTRNGVVRRGPFGHFQQSVEVQSESIVDAASPVSPPEAIAAGIRLAIYSSLDDEDALAHAPPLAPLQYGQRLRFTTRLHPPHNFGNPGAWDQKSYLARQGILALASTRADEVELLPGVAGSRLAAWRAKIRRSLLARFYDLWGVQDGPLISAMLVGDQLLVDRETRLAFQRTGVYHILVVSGMNVGILAFVVFWTVRRLGGGDGLSTVITLLTTAAYTALTDLGAPILRATIMLWIYLGVRLLYRDRHPLNPLGAAALGLLVIDPPALFDTSFQLTFICVLAIAGAAVPLLERIAQPYRRALADLDSVDYDLHLEPRLVQLRLDLRLLIERLGRLLPQRAVELVLIQSGRSTLAAFEVLLVAAIMQVVMVGPMAVYFHRAALLTVPANSVVVPLIGVLMPAALLATGISYVSAYAAWIPAKLTSITLHAMTATVRDLAGLRVVDLRMATPSVLVMVLAAAGFALALLTARSRRLFTALGFAALLASATWIATVPPARQWQPGELEITALDVGQGDSLLVITPGGKTVLVDAGGSVGQPSASFDVGEDVVSPYLWDRGISRLDATVITHQHADHMGGMRSVIANFRPHELWLSRLPAGEELNAVLREARTDGVAVRQFAAGSGFEFGGATVQVLSPSSDWQPASKPRNNDSLVLKFSYAGRSALLEGDADKKVERLLAARDAAADLLKVGHHGSANSTSPELLACVRPKFAVITAGHHNRFGYPRREVLARLAGAGVATYRTDLEGAVTFYLGADGISATLPNRR